MNYGIGMSFGTAIHDTLEIFRNKDVKSRPTLEKANSIFVRKLIKEHMKIKKLTKPYNIREYVEAGKVILKCLDQHPEFEDAQVVWNEYELYEDIDRSDGLKIKFKGFIDIALKVKAKRGKESLLLICDFKTCSWGWGRDKKQDADLHSQLFFYKHFVCKKFDLDPKNVRTTFILLKRKPSSPDDAIEFFTVSSGPKAMERAMERLQEDITKMNSGVYEKNREACKNKYGDTCPYYKSDLCPGE